MSGSDHADGVGLIVPSELLADANLGGGREILSFGRERHGIFTLRIRDPSACAVVHHVVPLIPAAMIVLVKDTANHPERFVTILVFGVKLNRRNVGGKV